MSSEIRWVPWVLGTAIGLVLLQTFVVGTAIAAARYVLAGEVIVFGENGDTSEDLFILDVKIGRAYNVTGSMDDTYEREPAWSPDGSQIAFMASPHAYISPHIFVMDMDGGNLRQLTDYFGFSPVWSPDGRQVAFRCYFDSGLTDICLIDANGDKLRPLTHTPETDEYSPTWSPDGRYIAFQSFRQGSGYGIYVIGADGSNKQQLIRGDYLDPRWSPDGTRIAFRADGGENMIFVMAVDSGDLQPLTTHALHLYGMAWLPDARHIAIVAARCYCDPEVYVLDIDSGEEVHFPFGGFGGYVPVWRPR